MMKARKIGTIAALGGSTAALAMLTGLAGARADDLQVNQQLLNSRIDQLAAVGQQPGAGNQFSVDQNAATGAAVTAGSFPRSILIPGTDTSIKIYGQVTEILNYYLSGGQPGSGAATGVPWNTTVGDNGEVQALPLNNGGVAKARSNGIFGQSARESKIGFETRTPTPYGEARTVFEFDWAGTTAAGISSGDPTSVSDNLLPRLRYAYGTLGGLLAGQATSNFSTRTPTAKPSTSAAMSANRAMSASRRFATPCRPGGARRSRYRPNSPRRSSPPRGASQRTTPALSQPRRQAAQSPHWRRRRPARPRC